MNSFHVVIRAQGIDPTAALAVSFEELAAALETLDRLYFEPDGSFVWTGGSAVDRWQIDGLVYDRAGRVQYVDLKASAPPDAVTSLAEAVDRILAALATPLASLAFDQVESGETQNAAEFRENLTAGSRDATGP
jgi:hypothetical protein